MYEEDQKVDAVVDSLPRRCYQRVGYVLRIYKVDVK